MENATPMTKPMAFDQCKRHSISKHEWRYDDFKIKEHYSLGKCVCLQSAVLIVLE